MNSKAMPSIIQMEEERLQQLVTEIKETIATGINIQHQVDIGKKFGITDMWNSQKNARTAISRRRFWPKSF